MENITSYKLLSKYYDKIYKFQFGSSIKKRDGYIDFLLSLVIKKNKFLDIGCGTGIYTKIISDYFENNFGIDPCKDMILNINNKKNIIFKNIFLKDLKENNFDLVTSFSQVINHIDKDNINLFIKHSSEKLNKNGIFYFDFFNYDYFYNANPKYETRILDNNCKYIINPKLKKIDNDLIKLNLNNIIINNEEEEKYKLDINIYNFNFINKICLKNNLELIKLNKMLDIDTEINKNIFSNFAKYSAIYKKK